MTNAFAVCAQAGVRLYRIPAREGRMAMHKNILGMDIGGTHLRLGMVDHHHHLKHFAILPTQQVFGNDAPVAALTNSIRTYCRNDPARHPDAVALGFPSTIDRQRRKVISTPNISALQNLAISDELEEILGIPVYVNRDVNFLLLHDIKALSLTDKPVVLGIYIGTGVGNAISIDGKLLAGKNGAAGELGHIPLYGHHGYCGCGNKGCAETISAGKYLEQLRKEQFPDTPISELFSRHGKTRVMENFIETLSLPIATEINIFDPDSVVLGGGVLQMSDFPLTLLQDRIRKHTRRPYGESTEIHHSQPGQENGVIGAGIYGLKRLHQEDYI